MKLKTIFILLFVGIFMSRNWITDCPDLQKNLKAFDSLYVSTWIFVDFSKPSCQDRFWIYDGSRELNECVYSGVVLHGRGGNSTSSKPDFSNEIGSGCSSLGLYRLDGLVRMKNGMKAFKLIGLSKTNSNAEARHIYIHPSKLATLLPFNLPGLNFPLTNASEGCFAVSYPTFEYLKRYWKESGHDMCLYAYYKK